MITLLFLGFVVTMAALVVFLGARFMDRQTVRLFTVALGIWLLYVGLLAYGGVIRNTTMRPPGIAFLFLPILTYFAVLIWRMRSLAGMRFAGRFPLGLLLGLQCFRVGVELFLHQLWSDGLLPRMLTFSGANVEIYVGATAPLIAWLASRGQRRLALAWNLLGLLALANVVVRAVLTSPGPQNLIHAEVPNLMIGTFPFTYIAGFFVPLAVTLHVISIRALNSRPVGSVSCDAVRDAVTPP